MPLPFIAWLGAAAGTVVIAAVAFSSDNKKVQADLRGKVITILGPRGIGKTTLVSFLSTGELPSEFVATVTPKKYAGRVIRMDGLELVLQPITDVPGSKESHKGWQTNFQKADFICYIIDSSKIEADDQEYYKIVLGEVRNLKDWLEEREDSKPQVFLLASYCDRIPEYAAGSENDKVAFADKLWSKDAMRRLVIIGGGDGKIKKITGSLANKEEVTKLVGRLIHEIVN